MTDPRAKGGAVSAQPSLFDQAPGYGLPRARRSDPDSSHAAADRQERSGRAEADAQKVLAALGLNPGSTSRELSELHGLDRHMVARRLPDLERKGKVRRTTEGAKAIRWWPK